MNDPGSLTIGSKPAPDDLIFVQGFLNTRDFESGDDSFDSPTGVSSWFSRHGRLPAGAVVSENERRRVVALRAALRAALRSRHEGLPARAEPLLEVALPDQPSAHASLALTLGESGEVALEWLDNDIESQLAELLAIVHRSQLVGTWDRLKVCAADACQWAFYDASRNRSGTWCTMEVCGNREKVRAHRAKHEH